jgi:hypothetical protein
MKTKSDEFRENLLLHGADLRQWPEEARKAGLEWMRESVEPRRLLAEEERFEEILRERRF